MSIVALILAEIYILANGGELLLVTAGLFYGLSVLSLSYKRR